MDTLGIYLRTEWRRRFGHAYNSDQRQNKTLFLPNGEKLCEVTYSPQLERWYQSDRGKARYAKPKCFFCEGHDEFWELEKVAESDHLMFYYNIKSVAPCNFLVAPIEHREHPTPDDVLILQKLAVNTGLSIIGNFRDSGAGFPVHVHYQSLMSTFLIAEKMSVNMLVSYSFEVKKVNYPIVIFSFCSDSRNVKAQRVLVTAIAMAPKPYNLLFSGQNIFLVPRTKSVPFNTNGFKFAAAEVFGHVFTRSRQMYEDLDAVRMLEALNDVSLVSGSNSAKDYEGQLLECVKDAYDAV